MSRLFAKRAGIAALSGVLAAALLILMLAQDTDAGLAHPHAFGGATWAFPFVVGACVGLVAWWALGSRAESSARETADAACPICGRPVRDDWRLCPDCGTLIEDDAAKSAERPLSA